MRLALALILSFISGCAELRLDTAGAPEPGGDKATDQIGNSWTEDRKALYQQAREGLRQSSDEQYIPTTRPILQRTFRQDRPNLTDAESMRRWRKDSAQRQHGDRRGQSCNLQWTACLPGGGGLPIRIA